MNGRAARLLVATMMSQLLLLPCFSTSVVLAAEQEAAAGNKATAKTDADARALQFLEMAVEAGSPRAKRLLGEQLIRGEKLPRDQERGVALLEEAAETDADAQLLLGRMFLTGDGLPSDVPRGISLLEAAAKAGKSSAARLLGIAYLKGDVPGGPQKAEDLLRQAAADGNAEAGRTLALALIQGRALPKDVNEGMQLLESASDAGDRSAMLLLGKLLLRGEDVEQDLDRAARLFQLLADEGDGEGLQILGENYLWGTYTRRNPEKAEALLSRAAELGQEKVWSTLANGAISQRLGRRSQARFEEFAEKAREAADPRIVVYEAERHLRGAGVPQNVQKAIKILETAAAAGNSEAASHLIALHRDGRGKLIRRSPRKARAYLEEYFGTFSDDDRGLQAFLLDVAVARSREAFEELLTAPDNAQYLSDFWTEDDILAANANFAVYRVQKILQSRGMYDGALDGLLKSATIKGMQQACGELAIGARCQQRVLAPRIIGRLIHGWEFSPDLY